jgi:hypothetical protein
MNCLTTITSIEEWFGVIDRCAAAYGGERWVETALLGLLTVALAGLLAIALLSILRSR